MNTLIFLAILNSSVSVVVPNLDSETCNATLRDLNNSVRGYGTVRFSRCVPQMDVKITDQKELDGLMNQVQQK